MMTMNKLLLWIVLCYLSVVNVICVTLHNNCNLCSAETKHLLHSSSRNTTIGNSHRHGRSRHKKNQHQNNENKDNTVEDKSKFYRPIVDVFLFVVTGSQTKQHYIHSGEFWVIPLLVKEMSFNPKTDSTSDFGDNYDSRIHIITDSTEVFQAGSNFSKPFYMYQLKDFDAISAPFKELYAPNHGSVNDLEYEFLCFNRWHIMKHIMIAWNKENDQLNATKHHNHSPMTRILSLDLDVLLLQNAAKFVDNTLRTLVYSSPLDEEEEGVYSENPQLDVDFEVVVIGLGAINIFSQKGLIYFSDFIFSWYNRSKLEIKASTKPYGKFFSDMMIMKEFLIATNSLKLSVLSSSTSTEYNSSSRNACFEYWKASEYYSDWKATPENLCLFQRLQCVPMSGFREMSVKGIVYNYIDLKRKEEITSLEHGSVFTVSELAGTETNSIALHSNMEHYPYCLMHFQGREMKSFLYLYGVLMLMLVNPIEYPIEATINLPIESEDQRKQFELSTIHTIPMLVRKPHSKEIYLAQGGVSHKITEWDLLQKYHLSHLPVVAVREELFKLFIVGDPIS